MNLIDKIHRQRSEIKREKRMIPTELGNKIIHNFKVPARNNKNVIKRYTKTSKRNNKLHKKGDIKFRRVRDYDDFIHNYDLILKINGKDYHKYKYNAQHFGRLLLKIVQYLHVNNGLKIIPKIKKRDSKLLQYEKFFNNLNNVFNVSNGNQLLAKIQELRDNQNTSQNNQNDSNNQNNDQNNNSDQSDDSSQYHFGKIE